MRPASKQIWSTVLVVAVLLLGWLVVRATQSPGTAHEAARPGQSVTTPAPTKPAERHTQAATDPFSGLRSIPESDLPPEARHTLTLIRAGGPYPYPRNDDQVFGNRERLLPAKARGYYREFTVATPGSPDRGPRRIVAGASGEKYWTDDHYASFSRIQEGT